MRCSGKISAFEMYFNRNMHTGQNLNLDYEQLRRDQLETRKLHNDKHNSKLSEAPVQYSPPIPGDIVSLNLKQGDKHKAKDSFIITAQDDDKIKMQKIIYSNSKSTNPNIRQKQYYTKVQRVHVTRRVQTNPDSSKNLFYSNQHIGLL